MNTYNSIIPSEMTASEIRNLCAELLTAKNWKQENAEVMLESGERKVIPVNKLSYYQEFHRVETGGINSKSRQNGSRCL